MSQSEDQALNRCSTSRQNLNDDVVGPKQPLRFCQSGRSRGPLLGAMRLPLQAAWRSGLQETVSRHGGFKGEGGCGVLGRGTLGARPRRVRTEGAEAPKAL